MASEQAKRDWAMHKLLGQTETIVYRPGGMPDEGEPDNGRTIDAQVDRASPQEVMHGAAPAMRVTVLNDATLGISTVAVDDVPAIDRGSDLLEIAELVGGVRQPRGIQRIESQDTDYLVLAIK